jgi:hypothetical protein
MKLLYLGTHMEGWLEELGVPLFVSHRRLRRRTRTLPRASARWALDSGAFTELRLHGGWRTSEADYVKATRRYRDEIGLLDWAAPMDWMCEPFMLKRTGWTLREHQQFTVENFLELRHQAPDLPYVPVLQGWSRDDYMRCWNLYEGAGVHLEDEPIVGVGSVCRRQATHEAHLIFSALRPLRLHGFGVKTLGLQRFADLLFSCDSQAWSLDARRTDPLPGHLHVNCANCIDYALLWRMQALERIGGVP